MAPDTQSIDFNATFHTVGLALAFPFDSAPSRTEHADGETLSAAVRRVDFDGEDEEEVDEDDKDDLDDEEDDEYEDEDELDDDYDEDDELEDDEEDEEEEENEEELNLI